MSFNQDIGFRLKLAYRCANSPTDFVFHLGYQQFVPPRFVRRIFARSLWHRAWQSGYTGAGILSVEERTRLA
jgi:hypothetical protein